MVFSRFSAFFSFFHLPYACSSKLVPGVSLLFVSLSRVSGRDGSALYGPKAPMNDNENVIYRVNELSECCKLSSQKFYSLFFSSMFLPCHQSMWRHSLNLTTSGPPNPFEITSINISVCNINVSQLEFPKNISVSDIKGLQLEFEPTFCGGQKQGDFKLRIIC